MRFRISKQVPVLHSYLRPCHHRRQCFTSLFGRAQASAQAGASSDGGGKKSQGNPFLVPGATVATLFMLGALHARRMYNDKKDEDARERGIEVEFSPDFKATFLRMLPLRSISRCWGKLTGIELPVWLRPYVYRGWARAFHSYLEEAGLPLESYASLRDFFVRSLKEGCRPIDPDPHCLVSPVDGTILRLGELKESGALIEQVKGFSYSVSSLLGAKSLLSMIPEEKLLSDNEQKNNVKEHSRKSWWTFSLAFPKVRDSAPSRPVKGLYYCVIYLRPGDYHRIHSPADWNVFARRHFSGNLFPTNERATKTIRNLYVENERVVLEGLWQEGFMAMAAIGATNVGSIELFIEPELLTNQPRKKMMNSEPPDERIYEPEGVGKMIKKGDELAAFNMGSTVVLIFQAPTVKQLKNKSSSPEFRFNVQRGDRVQVGRALGKWHD